MNFQQNKSFSSEEIEYYKKNHHSASILAQKDDLKRIKFEMTASYERNDNMMDESYHDQHPLLPFMKHIEKSYNEILNQKTTTVIDQSKKLTKLSLSADILKRLITIQKAAINILVEKLIDHKTNEKIIECHRHEYERNKKCLEDALVNVKSKLADKNCEIKKLHATVRDNEHVTSTTRQQLEECAKRCDELSETVSELNAQLKCRSNELDDERTNANRLKSLLEYERESHDNQSKMDCKRIKDMQMQCDDLTNRLNEEKLQSRRLASKLSDMTKTCEAAAACDADERQRNTCAPTTIPMTTMQTTTLTSKPPACDTKEDKQKRKIKKIKNFLRENETNVVRIKEIKNNKCCATNAAAAAATAVASTTKCHFKHGTKQEKCIKCEPPKSATEVHSFCNCYVTKIEKPSSQCAESSSLSSLATTTNCCGNAKTADSQGHPSTSHHHPMGNYKVEVQKLLSDLSQDVRKMYYKNI